jgi:hypothetical protein
MNTRIQFAMPAELRKRAKARAAELGITFSEYISRLIASDLGEEKPKSKADISIILTSVHPANRPISPRTSIR